MPRSQQQTRAAAAGLFIRVISALFVATCATAGKFKVSYEDMVVAFPVDAQHATLGRASRVWRKGMRTLIASNSPPTPEQEAEAGAHNENWVIYPDDMPLRSLYGGDSRAALVPFLAHKTFGDTYKWVLYGDDDTIFFMDGIFRLLEDFDPEMPYFITDHYWWATEAGRANHPNKEAPRCLPCHHDVAGQDTSNSPWPAPIGCPCRPELLCATDPTHHFFNQWCDIPRAPIATYSMHGGAGALISVGLLRNITWDWIEHCVKKLYSTGGDAFISICLWKAGFAMTDPGVAFYRPEVQMFDPGPEDRMGVMMRLARALDNRCDAPCMDQLHHMLTLHVRSRMFPTLDDAAFFVRAASELYEQFAALRRSHEQIEATNAAQGLSTATQAALAAAQQATAGGQTQAAVEQTPADAANPAQQRRRWSS